MNAPIFVIRSGKSAGKALNNGDWFRVPGESGQVYRFHGHKRHDSGAEAVDAWGGDKDPKARQGWRCFRASESFVPAKAPQAPKKKERDK